MCTHTFTQQWHEHDGQKSTGVDGEIEKRKELRSFTTHVRWKLIGGESGHTRFDAACVHVFTGCEF
jgi:hypothetical protein